MNWPKETITLRWLMDDESWSNWAQGRGRKTASSVILEGLKEIRKSPKAREGVRRECERISERPAPSAATDPLPSRRYNKIEIQLPGAEWGEACQLVGRLRNNTPVSPAQLLAAMICESPSWRQKGSEPGEYDAGWNLPRLISCVIESTNLTHTEAQTGKAGKGHSLDRCWGRHRKRSGRLGCVVLSGA